jgi:hypothetical protein|tara:strand:+ start:313 stop:891 length:579 start_codon:yes stop_codon:yes gene_type:complete
MANSSTIGFGLKPIRAYGNGYESMGLGEYPVAASSAAMFFQDLIVQAASGFVTVGVAGTENILGSLNGVFFTDTNTSKPTFANHLLANNTAANIVALVNDSPMQQYEVRSNNAAASAQTDVGNTADIAYAAGSTANFVSRATLNDATLNNNATQQLKVIGVSRDPENQDLTTANVVWRVLINQSFFNDLTGV